MLIFHSFIFLLSSLLFGLSSNANPSYSINLMWINKDINDEQQYFCSTAKDFETYEQVCLKPIVEWLNNANEASTVNIWYDSKTTKNDVIDRLISDIKSITNNNVEKLKFLDIRNLPDVTNDESIFDLNVPIYFRVDLLRAIIADYLAKNSMEQYVIYSDLNIPALSGPSLFDEETLNNLKKYGFVMAKNNAADLSNRYENAFFIIDAHNSSFLHAHRTALIDLNIERGKEFLQRGYTRPEEIDILGGKALCKSMFNEIIFVSYKSVFAYYLYLNMALEIILDDELGKDISYIVNYNQKENTDNSMKKSWNALTNIRKFYDGIVFPFSPLFGVPVGLQANTNDKYLFERGYAVVHFAKLIDAHGAIPLVYLAPFKIDNSHLNEVQSEKDKRRSMPPENIFGIHNSGLKKPFYRWLFSNYYLDNETIKIISLSKGLGNPPIKQVNKPVSKFYATTPASGNDC